MKLGDLISLKPEYDSSTRRRVYLIVGQLRNAQQHCYEVMDRKGQIINIPLSSVFAYEVFSEAT